MDGLVLIRKSSGPTSHDCVAGLRRILKTENIWHFGTLDPFATGVLVCCINRAFAINSSRDSVGLVGISGRQSKLIGGSW